MVKGSSMGFKRILGSTDLEISAIGLGTVKFGRNQKVHYPSAFEVPSEYQLEVLLNKAREQNINFLDTAPAYGHSEERLGRLLKGQRQEWVISTKVGEEFKDGQSYFDFSAAAIQGSIARSLKLLQTDYLDLVLVHSNGDDLAIIEHNAVFETLAHLKKQGLIRAFGMSTKTLAGGLRTIELADVAMVTYNAGHLSELPIIEAAHRQQKGILIKKALASGHLDSFATQEDPVKAAMRFVLKTPGVHAAVVGTIQIEHLVHNLRCAREVLAELS